MDPVKLLIDEATKANGTSKRSHQIRCLLRMVPSSPTVRDIHPLMIDPQLQGLSRSIRKGKTRILKFAGEDLSLDANFKLFLQTKFSTHIIHQKIRLKLLLLTLLPHLIYNLEDPKKISVKISEKVEIAIVAEAKIRNV